MGKNVIFLAIALLFGAKNLKSQDSIFTETKKILLGIEAFAGGGRERIAETYSSRDFFSGIRVTVSKNGPFFAFWDTYYYTIDEKDYSPHGAPLEFKDESIQLDAGMGFGENLQLTKFFGIGIEATLPLTELLNKRIPLPTLTPGFYFNYGSWYLGGFNSFVIGRNGVWYPVFILGREF